jgi:tetratricopeptide (TPR) repeat protein
VPHFLLAGGWIALTFARWLLPAEASVEGETLWIAGLWFLVGAAVAFHCGRANACRRRLDAADLAAALFVGGHVLSGVVVLATQGDRRAALNLVWEWLSLGVFWFAGRTLLADVRLRHALIPLMLVTAAMLSTWGVWQRFVWYPQMQREYAPLFARFRDVQRQGGDLAAIQAQLAERGLPIDASSLALFENRLLQSREPFGPFALANTFGGVLAAWLVMGILAIDWKRAASRWPISQCLGISTLALIAFCLYLTNSRTAWAGTIIALLAGLAIRLLRRALAPPIAWRAYAGLVAAGILAGAIGLSWIATHEYAVPGPLKSLAYRTQYWGGTWRLIETMPWFGSGLGQFRDRYLAFRVPESSEEIADPHNLLLDAWSNGGVIALAGLLGLIAILLIRLWKNSADRDERTTTSGGPSADDNSVFAISCFLAFPLVIAGQWISTGYWDGHADRLAVFAVVWAVLALVLMRLLRIRERAENWAGPLAALALTVHLLGAGGIGMPAVTGLWLFALVLGLPVYRFDSLPNAHKSRLPFAVGLVALLLAAGCYFTGWLPAATARRRLAEGDRVLLRSKDVSRAEQFYEQAAQADPISPEPWQRLAELEAAQAGPNHGTRDASHLRAALEFQTEAIRRAPFRAHGYFRQGELAADLARRTGAAADWEAAITAFSEAERRHPTHVRLLTEFAFALDDARRTETAREIAIKALAQDDLNRRRGHTERFLSEETRSRLEEIAVR